MDIYVFGLGHVGLPLACWIALAGYHVDGIDIDSNTAQKIRDGKIEIEEYFHDMHIKDLARKLIEQGRFDVSTSFSRTSNEPAIFLVSVGIADKPDGGKDLSPILSVLETIDQALVPGDLIILRSTMIPGTCENVLVPKMASRSIPFFLAYCPETIIETKAFEELEHNPMILAGMNEESYDRAEHFLRTISHHAIYRASNIRTAEMAKVVQNIHRDVDIALANELSDAARSLKIDSEELQMLTNVNPRVSMLTAGPGVGGYCLPNALGYLRCAVPETQLTLAKTARMQNEQRPRQIVEMAMNALREVGKQPENAVIAVAGLAMKNECADIRFSPALDIIDEIQKTGARVKAYDPLVPKQFPFQVSSLTDCLQGADCLIIAAKQNDLQYDALDIAALMATRAIVIDTQHTMKYVEGAKLYKI